MQVASSSDTENRQHVKNVEQAFEQLGEPAKAEKCLGIRLIRGLMEKVEINRDESGPSVLMCKTLGAAS